MSSLARQTFPALVLVCLLASLVEAQPPVREAARTARRDVEIAELRLRLYVRVDFALRLRRLDSEIKLTEAEAASIKRILEQYRPLERLRPSPLLGTRERTKLQLLETELRLKDLRAERLLLRRYHPDQRRLFELEAERARDRERSLRRGVQRRAITFPPGARIAADR